MTKSFLNQNFDTVFQHFFLFNQDGQTLLAASQAMPSVGKSCFAYLPATQEFDKVEPYQVVAYIRNITFKTKI